MATSDADNDPRYTCLECGKTPVYTCCERCKTVLCPECRDKSWDKTKEGGTPKHHAVCKKIQAAMKQYAHDLDSQLALLQTLASDELKGGSTAAVGQPDPESEQEEEEETKPKLVIRKRNPYPMLGPKKRHRKARISKKIAKHEPTPPPTQEEEGPLPSLIPLEQAPEPLAPEPKELAAIISPVRHEAAVPDEPSIPDLPIGLAPAMAGEAALIVEPTPIEVVLMEHQIKQESSLAQQSVLKANARRMLWMPEPILLQVLSIASKDSELVSFYDDYIAPLARVARTNIFPESMVPSLEAVSQKERKTTGGKLINRDILKTFEYLGTIAVHRANTPKEFQQILRMRDMALAMNVRKAELEFTSVDFSSDPRYIADVMVPLIAHGGVTRIAAVHCEMARPIFLDVTKDPLLRGKIEVHYHDNLSRVTHSFPGKFTLRVEASQSMELFLNMFDAIEVLTLTDSRVTDSSSSSSVPWKEEYAKLEKLLQHVVHLDITVNAVDVSPKDAAGTRYPFAVGEFVDSIASHPSSWLCLRDIELKKFDLRPDHVFPEDRALVLSKDRTLVYPAYSLPARTLRVRSIVNREYDNDGDVRVLLMLMSPTKLETVMPRTDIYDWPVPFARLNTLHLFARTPQYAWTVGEVRLYVAWIISCLRSISPANNVLRTLNIPLITKVLWPEIELFSDLKKLKTYGASAPIGRKMPSLMTMKIRHCPVFEELLRWLPSGARYAKIGSCAFETGTTITETSLPIEAKLLRLSVTAVTMREDYAYDKILHEDSDVLLKPSAADVASYGTHWHWHGVTAACIRNLHTLIPRIVPGLDRLTIKYHMPSFYGPDADALMAAVGLPSLPFSLRVHIKTREDDRDELNNMLADLPELLLSCRKGGNVAFYRSAVDKDAKLFGEQRKAIKALSIPEYKEDITYPCNAHQLKLNYPFATTPLELNKILTEEMPIDMTLLEKLTFSSTHMKFVDKKRKPFGLDVPTRMLAAKYTAAVILLHVKDASRQVKVVFEEKRADGKRVLVAADHDDMGRVLEAARVDDAVIVKILVALKVV